MLRNPVFSVAIAVILALCTAPALAIQFYGTVETSPWITWEQPNEGTPVTFEAKMWGNSIFWEHETYSGYTIFRNPITSFWTYATLDTNRTSGQGMIRILRLGALG